MARRATTPTPAPTQASTSRFLSVLALLLSVVLPAVSAAESIRLQGSTLAFERLEGLREELAARLPDVPVDWRGDGTGAAFVALFDGSADVAVSSRPIEEREKALAAKLGLSLREYVLALDGVAVVVHPSNPVESLSIQQLETILSGKIVAWHGVGGSGLEVRLVVPPASGGMPAFVRERFQPEGPLADGAVVAESETSAVGMVASDPRAFAFVSMSEDRAGVKTLPIRDAGAGDGVVPSFATVSGGAYPLTREIRLYVRGDPEEKLRRVLSFLLLSDGQAKVRASGLVPIVADRPIQRTLPSRTTTEPAPVERVLFAFGGSRLNAAARQALDGVPDRARQSAGEVWITGHIDPSEEGRNRGRLDEDRARVVETYLRDLGVPAFRVESLGASEPLSEASGLGGAGIDGAIRNRRADVWLLKRR